MRGDTHVILLSQKLDYKRCLAMYKLNTISIPYLLVSILIYTFFQDVASQLSGILATTKNSILNQ